MVLWFLAGSRAPETAETPCPPPRASARQQPTPLPAEGFEERARSTPCGLSACCIGGGSGPRGGLNNAQSHCAGANQGAFRREWPALAKERNAESCQHSGSPPKNREGPPHNRRERRSARLNWQRPVLRSRALPTTLVRRLSVIQSTAWPTGCFGPAGARTFPGSPQPLSAG